MKIIITDRGGGKTTELIKLSARKNLYIVCKDMDEVDRIFSEAHEMKLKIPQPITFDCFINRRYNGRGIKGFLIDNAEHLIQHMTNVKVEAITMSNDMDCVKWIKPLKKQVEYNRQHLCNMNAMQCSYPECNCGK